MIDKKYLEGLKWKSSKEVINVKEGIKSKRISYESIERNLEVSDILSMREEGSFYIIITSDGKKYKIQKIIKKEVANAL